MKKISMVVMLGLFVGSFVSFAAVGVAQAETRAEVRSQIRQTPMLERPNRVGHIYGNNVRRMHHLRTGN
jgi:hypothetical protein